MSNSDIVVIWRKNLEHKPAYKKGYNFENVEGMIGFLNDIPSEDKRELVEILQDLIYRYNWSKNIPEKEKGKYGKTKQMSNFLEDNLDTANKFLKMIIACGIGKGDKLKTKNEELRDKEFTDRVISIVDGLKDLLSNKNNTKTDIKEYLYEVQKKYELKALDIKQLVDTI